MDPRTFPTKGNLMLPLQTAFLKVAYNEMGASEAVAWAEEEANKILQKD